MAPDGEINGGFKFPMNMDRYTEFSNNIPLETRIAFEEPSRHMQYPR